MTLIDEMVSIIASTTFEAKIPLKTKKYLEITATKGQFSFKFLANEEDGKITKVYSGNNGFDWLKSKKWPGVGSLLSKMGFSTKMRTITS